MWSDRLQLDLSSSYPVAATCNETRVGAGKLDSDLARSILHIQVTLWLHPDLAVSILHVEVTLSR